MERKKPPSNSLLKGHTSKKNAKGTSRPIKKGERKPFKRILPSGEASSDELVSIDESRNEQTQLISCATADETSQKESMRNLKIERIKPSKESLDKLVNIDEYRYEQAHLYSCITVGESNRKESVGKLKIERIKTSTSEPLKRQRNLTQKVVESLCSKEKAYKRLTSREKRFLGEMKNAGGSSRERPYPIHSRASSDVNSYLKTFKEIEIKSPSSSKSLRKIDFAKKNVEEIFQPTQSSRITSKKTHNHEESSSEESSDDANPPTSSGFSSSRVKNEGRKWSNYQPLPPVIKTTENRYNKVANSGEKITFDIFPSFGNKTDSRDNKLDGGMSLKESSMSEVLPDIRDGLKTLSSSPFGSWGKSTNVVRNSEADREPENDGTRVQDGARARMDPTQTAKSFQKYKDLKIKKDKKEKQSTSRTDHSDPQPQKGAFKSITPMVDSTVETKSKNYGIEAAGNDFAENSPKVVNNDIEKKENEKSKDPTRRSKLEDVKYADKIPEYGGSSENIADMKSSPIAAENRGGRKRLSDPSFILKENRPSPSV